MPYCRLNPHQGYGNLRAIPRLLVGNARFPLFLVLYPVPELRERQKALCSKTPLWVISLTGVCDLHHYWT